MVFSKQNLFYIFLVFIFSCSPKQIEVTAPQPKVIRPIWLDGLPEDSLFIYDANGILRTPYYSTLHVSLRYPCKILRVKNCVHTKC